MGPAGLVLRRRGLFKNIHQQKEFCVDMQRLPKISDHYPETGKIPEHPILDKKLDNTFSYINS
jgi:hypothetical protein